MLLAGESFDVVLADYLLGAIDGFAPYFQDMLFARLRPHVGERLYVVGLEPYPAQATTAGGMAILEIDRLRNACILLAGHRCYREYPMRWAIRQLKNAGFVIDEAIHVPIRYGPRFVNGQLDVCIRKLPHFTDQQLATQMRRHIESLRERTLALRETRAGIQFDRDYVIAAHPG